MSTPNELYNQLLTTGTQPAVVFYGHDERIELSGKVCANHIAKIANYLANEVDLIPGSRVVFDLPVHWKTIVWALGAMMAGGNVVVGRERIEDHEPDTVVVTSRPDGITVDDEDTIIALTLGSLAFEWEGDLPDGALDGAADVLAHPDQLAVSGLDTDSNAAFYAQALSNLPDDDRIAVVMNDVIPLLIVAFPALAEGKTLVVIGDGERDVAKICNDEGAVLFADTPTGRSL